MIGLALVVGLLGWPAPDDARQAARRVVEQESLQAELPTGAEARPPPMTSGSPSGGRRSRGSSPPPERAGSGLGPVVLWTVAGLLAIGLIAVLLRERMGPAATQQDAAPPSRPPPAPERAIVDEADALAAEGRFAEAVHALLLRTIDALGGHMPVPRALTSREIKARAGLPTAAREAFGDLVGAVELTRFGGRSATADDYARCVACFDRIRAALGAG